MIASAGVFVLMASFPFRERNKLKTYNCIVFTVFEHTKLYPFQNLSLGFILNEIFLEFPKFQPRYSYKIYSSRKRECISEVNKNIQTTSVFVPGKSLLFMFIAVPFNPRGRQKLSVILVF